MKWAAVATLASARHLRLSLDQDPPADPTKDAAAGADDSTAAAKAKVEQLEKVAKVNEVLFKIACRMKHKADIQGKAKHKAVKEQWVQEDFQEFIEQEQAENVEQMKESC